MPTQTPPVGLDRFTTFGDLLKFLRRRQGLTQRELSIAVGYSHAQISRLELNQRLPDLATIAARFVPALDLEGEVATAARLMDLAVAMQRDDAPASGAAPFKGLNFFDESDADLFFGREAITARLVERMAQPSGSAEGAVRFLAVVGASGSGKSSIVRAGLIPALRWRRDPAWTIAALTPTARPVSALAAALTTESPRPASERVLVVVDQFEEVFTLCRDKRERQAFIDQLLALAAAAGGQTWVVLTLRADFYAQCAPFPALRAALAAQQDFIGPMAPDELRKAIEEPARRGGWELEEGLVDLLLHDLGADGRQPPEPGALPLLSHALLETWRRRRGRTLTISGYLASGGVQGAIAETADVVYHDDLDEGQQSIARDIFLRLTQLGDESGAAETRRRVALAELTSRPGATVENVRGVLNQLADARLITTGDDVVEVAHEALIREWPTLRGWLEADREGLRLHRHLTLAAESWRLGGRETGDLYRGARLAQVHEWAEQNPAALNESEREFLAASQALVERESAEHEAQRQRELDAARALAETQSLAARSLRRRALYLGVALLLAVGMAAAALYFGEQSRQSALQAQQFGRLATARELAAAAVNNLAVDPERSILLSLQAISTTRAVGEAVVPEAESALHQSVLASRVRQSLTGINTRVLTAVFSPDGQRAAGIGDDGKVVIWDVETGAELLVLPGLTVPGDAIGVQRLAFSPDGRTLATGDAALVRLWNAETGAEIASLAGHTGEVWCVVFSPDGRRIASAGVDGTVRWWDAVTGETLLAYAAHPNPIESIAISPDGRHLATGGDDFALRLWNAATGELESELTGLNDAVYGVAFSPDGQFLAVANVLDAPVWDTTSMSQALILNAGAGGVAFSPDGQRLAGVSGSSAKIWDVRTGALLLTLPGHTDWVNTVAFSPDGTQLLTSSMDQTMRVWDLTPGAEALSVETRGIRLAYAPDGLTFATETADGAARVWDTMTGHLLGELAGHSGGLFGLAYSADSKRLATASSDGTARVWNLATLQTEAIVTGHGDNVEEPALAAVRDVAFSPDGTRVATAGFDGTARVWEAATGRQVHVLVGHSGLVVGVAYNAGGTRLATSSTDGSLMVWDAATGERLLAWHSHEGANLDIAFSPDGERLLTGGSDATARVWDAATGDLLLTLDGHRANIWSVAYSQDGRRVATGSADGTVKVWDAETGALLNTLAGSQAEVMGVAFSPDGMRLAASNGDGIVRIYLLDLDDLMDLAHARLTRTLTLGECQTFLHLAACPPGSGPGAP